MNYDDWKLEAQPYDPPQEETQTGCSICGDEYPTDELTTIDTVDKRVCESCMSGSVSNIYSLLKLVSKISESENPVQCNQLSIELFHKKKAQNPY